MRCGKTLSRWFFNQSNYIYGGVPPTIDNIKTELDLVNYFFDSLIFHRTQLTYKTNFKRILATTVLIFHEAFLGIIGNEPFFKYKDSTHHTFLQKSISVISETQLSMETFRKWQDEVIAGFNKNIWLVIDISKFGRGFVKRYVGSRCVVSVIDGKG